MVVHACAQVVQEKLEEKEAHEEGRHMGIMQYLLTAGGWDMQTMDHPKALGDILEAALGAVTLDCAFDMPQILQVPPPPRLLVPLLVRPLRTCEENHASKQQKSEIVGGAVSRGT